jgi:hypothetical protein
MGALRPQLLYCNRWAATVAPVDHAVAKPFLIKLFLKKFVSKRFLKKFAVKPQYIFRFLPAYFQISALFK